MLRSCNNKVVASQSRQISADLNPIRPRTAEARYRIKRNRPALRQGFCPRASPSLRNFVADLKQLTRTAFRSAHDESCLSRNQTNYEQIAGLNSVPSPLIIFSSLDAIVPAAHARCFERVPGQKSQQSSRRHGTITALPPHSKRPRWASPAARAVRVGSP
jgi:hypothetical protein